MFIMRNPGKDIPEEMKKSGGDMMKKNLPVLIGFLAGMLNGLFGSGGGTVAVPLYKKQGLKIREAHATSVAVMLVLSIFSAGVYYFEGVLDFSAAADFIPGGILGGLGAALFFKRINPFILRKIFGAFVTFSALRMLREVIAQWI